MSTRLRTVGVLALLDRVRAALAERLGGGGGTEVVKAIDSKPLRVGRYTKDRDAKTRPHRGRGDGPRVQAARGHRRRRVPLLDGPADERQRPGRGRGGAAAATGRAGVAVGVRRGQRLRRQPAVRRGGRAKPPAGRAAARRRTCGTCGGTRRSGSARSTSAPTRWAATAGWASRSGSGCCGSEQVERNWPPGDGRPARPAGVGPHPAPRRRVGRREARPTDGGADCEIKGLTM